MDFFGIGAAVKGVTEIYFKASRQTGRTYRLLQSLKDGDRVYFATASEARHFENLCKCNGRDIECVVIPTTDPGQVFQRGTTQGRAVFDHGWVEQFYREQLDNIERDIKRLEIETGGYGEAHEQTRMQAEQIARWRS